MNSKRK